MLDNRLNNDFISYFLSLLHEEGNKYLQILNKTSHSTPTKQPQHPITNITNITPTNSKQRHEQFENKMQTLNTSLIFLRNSQKKMHGGQWPLSAVFGFNDKLGCRSMQKDKSY